VGWRTQGIKKMVNVALGGESGKLAWGKKAKWGGGKRRAIEKKRLGVNLGPSHRGRGKKEEGQLD